MPDPVQTPDAPPERASFGDLATQIAGTREDLLNARRNEERVLKEQATTQAPQIERAKTQLGAITAEGTARTTTLEAAKPEITPPPSRKLTEFLSPVQGESPETSVLKMIQGLGLLAGSIGGLARGDARGALAGLKGALAGWSEGDAARADRAFKDWQAKTDAALTKWRVESESYDRWFNNQNLSVEMMLKGFELDAIAHGNGKAVAAARSGRFEEALKYLTDTRKLESDAETRRLMISQAHADRVAALQANQDRWDRTADLKERELDLKEKQANTSPFTDEDVQLMARLFIQTRQQPSFGMGASARPDRARFWSAVRQLSGEYGGPEGIVARQAAAAGLKGELAAVMKTRGLVEAFSNTARKNLLDAEKLSEAVDRTGSPMFNKWLLAGRKAWSGDADVVDFDVAARTAINETARVLNSANASGVISDTARREIEEMLNTALNKEQFLRAVKRLLKEMDNRRTSYDEQIAKIDTEIRAVGKPDALNTMRIKRRSDSKEFDGPVGPVPEGYDRVR